MGPKETSCHFYGILELASGHDRYVILVIVVFIVEYIMGRIGSNKTQEEMAQMKEQEKRKKEKRKKWTMTKRKRRDNGRGRRKAQ